jgi:Fur family peroxide stress response transcriptional regulator
MDAEQITGRMRLFEELCRRAGVPVTVQRRVILETVLDRDDHATADQVYESVKGRLPGVSRTTVYRTLDMLVEMGVIRRLHHPGPASRFDGKVHRHHHLVCQKCNKVIDLESAAIDKLPLPDVRAEDFQIDDFSVHFAGVCGECRRKQADQ